jgi:hypothetical protein
MKKFHLFEWYEKAMGIKWNLSNVWGKLTRPFIRTFQWAVKVVQYAKFLWNDFDWDFGFFLSLMQYKLKRMRTTIIENNNLVRSEEIGAQIKHAEDLIQKYLNHDYCVDLYEAHEKKWGKTVDLSEKIDAGCGQTMYTWNMSRENATTPELKQQEKDEALAIYERGDEEERKTLDEIFSHIRKHLEEWWD